jgi:transposase
LPDRCAGSIDSTGLESRYVSRYFLKRASRLKKYRRWIKLTFVCEHATHLIAAVVVNMAPTNDASHFRAAMTSATKRLRFWSLVADGAYDCEDFHALCRKKLGIKRTAIPLNTRGWKCGVKAGRYRRQMEKHFPKKLYKQRWQIESTVSQLKRHLGADLTATSHWGRIRETMLRVVTHNLTILGHCA